MRNGASVHPLLLNTQRLDERLLEGMDDLDPSFRVWVLAKRQTIHERLMRSLDAAFAAATVPPEAKNEIAAAIANLDPTHEHACCYLMQARAEEGDVAGALRIYKALWDLLDRDYGMEPSRPTEELVARIKLGAFERPPSDRGDRTENAARIVRIAERHGPRDTRSLAPAGGSAKPRLVLRPFAMHGVDGDRAHLVQGFSLHLAASLVRFREWSVIDRPAGTVALSSPEAAPQYCIETTAYQAGAEINMVMVLRDETSGICIWSESLRLGAGQLVRNPAAHHPPDCDLAERAVVGRAPEAARRRAGCLARRLRSLASRPESDGEVRLRKAGSGRSPSSAMPSATIPTFSPCYSSLVQMNNVEHFVHPGVLSRPRQGQGNPRARKNALCSWIRSNSRAHLCCGWSHVMALREAEAAPHMELACELNDNDPWTLLSAAAYSAFCGSIEQARLRAAQSLALSPVPSIWSGATTASFASSAATMPAP